MSLTRYLQRRFAFDNPQFLGSKKDDVLELDGPVEFDDDEEEQSAGSPEPEPDSRKRKRTTAGPVASKKRKVSQPKHFWAAFDAFLVEEMATKGNKFTSDKWKP